MNWPIFLRILASYVRDWPQKVATGRRDNGYLCGSEHYAPRQEE